MKYQIYLQKDVSDIINAIAQGLHKKPSTLIKEMLESNFRTAYSQAIEQGALDYDQKAKARKL